MKRKAHPVVTIEHPTHGSRDEWANIDQTWRMRDHIDGRNNFAVIIIRLSANGWVVRQVTQDKVESVSASRAAVPHTILEMCGLGES